MTQVPPERGPRPPAGTPPPLPPPLPRPVLPLGYAAEPPRSRGPLAARMMIGFFGYLLLSGGWMVFASQTQIAPKTVWSGWFLMTTGLLGLALYLRIRFRYAGFGYGILLALGIGALLLIGLVLLIIGLCFSK